MQLYNNKYLSIAVIAKNYVKLKHQAKYLESCVRIHRRYRCLFLDSEFDYWLSWVLSWANIIFTR